MKLAERFGPQGMRSTFGVLLTMAIVSGLVVAASQAEGLQVSRSNSNDGGAWLVNRQFGVVGHVNRAVRQVSSVVGIAAAGSEIDVDQGRGIIAAVDRSTETVVLVDDATGLTGAPVSLPAAAGYSAVDGGLVVWSPEPLRVWRFDPLSLTQVGDSISAAPPTFQGGSGKVSVAPGGAVVVYDRDAQAISWLGSAGSERDIANVEVGDQTVQLSQVGSEAVLLVGDQIGITKGAGIKWQRVDGPLPAVLAQPSSMSAIIAGATAEGQLVEVDLATGKSRQMASVAATEPLTPIEHRNCVFGTFVEPPTFVRSCRSGGEFLVEETALPGFGSELRLRLVNGWVWINDLESGQARVASIDGDLSAIDDWGQALEQLEDEDELIESSTGGGELEQRENPDAEGAELGNDDEIDEDDENQPPVAEDDDSLTVPERPVVVPVLLNDSDPDGDVLRVDSVTIADPESGTAVMTPTGDGVQMTPQPGFTGIMRAAYEISDGRGGTDSAQITLDVRVVDGSTNRPPVPKTDVIAARPGTPASIDVLANDVDPDGDLLVLQSVSGEGGSPVFSADGRLTFTPDSSGEANEIQLTYVVADDWGATAEGRVVVKVRPADTNQRPDARNDFGTGKVGGRVILSVLQNDSDPDGDALVVAVQPQLVQGPPGVEAGALRVTAEGELFFAPVSAGTFVWTYGASDGQETDIAQIRIDVDDADTNSPPVAVRDEAVIPVGGTRVIPVLANDRDPDGDVIALIDEFVGPEAGLEVERVPDVGYRVTVRGDAPPRTQFVYEISDGVSEPVSAVVVVAVADVAALDQPPVLRPDIVDVRAGGTTPAFVLLNDFDPEGGSLQILETGDTPSAILEVADDGQSIEVTVPAGSRDSFTFTYDAADESNQRSSTTVRVRVIPESAENRPPIARPDRASTRADAAVSVRVLLNDSDPDGDRVTVAAITAQPENGTAMLAGDDGFIVYTPNPSFAGTDIFQYEVVDQLGLRAIGEVLIGVMPIPSVNTPPEAVDDPDPNREPLVVNSGGSPLRIPVLSNDFDADGDPLLVIDVSDPQAGNASIIEDGGAVLYEPPSPDPNGPLETSFLYTITDSAGGVDQAFVTVQIMQPETVDTLPPQTTVPPTTVPPTTVPSTTVPPTTTTTIPELPPVAVDDGPWGPVFAGEQVSGNVLANDSDPDGSVDDLVVSGGTGVTVGAGGVVTVSVPANASPGPVTFTYNITDPQGLSDGATITVTVAQDDPEPPVAEDDGPWGPVLPGEQVTGNVLANDSDPDGDDSTLAVVGGPGVVSVNGGQVTVQVPDDASGTATFSYTLIDTQGLEDTATILVNVEEPEPEPPQAVDDSSPLTKEGESVTIDVLANDIDPDGTVGDLTVLGGPRVTVNRDKTVTIVAPAETTDYTYTITDPDGLSDEGRITLLVIPNRAPETRQVVEVTEFETTVEVNLAGAAIDPDEDELIYTCCSAQQNGSTDVVSSGVGGAVVSFRPDDGFSGQASFSFSVDDGNGHQTAGVVLIDVAPKLNEPPTAQDATVILEAGTVLPLDLSNYASDPDPGDVLTIVASAPGDPVDMSVSGAIVTLSAPDNAQEGDDTSFTFTVTDDDGESATGNVFVDVKPTSIPPPLALADSASTLQGQAVTIRVLDNDNGQGISITQVGVSSNGSASLSGDAIVFTPTAGFGGAATTFNYEITDFADRTATGTVTVDVTGIPDVPSPPLAQDDGSQTCTVTWTTPAANGGTLSGYTLEDDQGGSYSPGLTTAQVLSSLANGATYRFRVNATNEAGSSAFSAWSNTCTPDIVPGTPPAPNVVPENGIVSLSWSAPSNDGSAITKYEVQVGGGTSGSQNTAATNLDWTGLNNGVGYQFRLRAENDRGFGEWGPWSSLTTPCTTPGAPGRPSATRGDEQLGVSWNPPSDDGGCQVERYEVSISPGGTRSSVATSLDFSQLVNGQPYTFEVRAENREGWSPWSAASDPQPPCGVPDAPPGPSANFGDQLATINWSAPDDNGCPLTGLEIRTGGTVRALTGSGTYTFSGLTNGSSYAFEIRGTNDVGAGPWSAASNSVMPRGKPICGGGAGPTGMAAQGGLKLVNSSWNSCDANGGLDFRYEVRLNSGSWTSVGTATSRQFTGLQDGTTYSVSVRAVNDVGQSSTSSASGTTWGVPGQTAGFGCTVENRYGSCNWSSPAANGSAINNYEVKISPGGTTDNGTSTKKNFPGLTYGTTYTVQVRACNAVGCGAWSNTKTFTPNRPAEVIASKGPEALNKPTCAAPCNYISVTTTGVPGPLSITCASTRFPNGFWNGPVANPNNVCFYGYTGDDVWVWVNGVRSNNVRW